MRRDKRGRRIGRNLWREYVTDTWSCAYQAWWLGLEETAMGYATEGAEYAALNPPPRLGDFMVALSPSWSNPMRDAA